MRGRDAGPAQATGAVGEPDDPLVDLAAALGAEAARLVDVGAHVGQADGVGEAADVVQVRVDHHRSRQEARCEQLKVRPHRALC